MVKYRASCPNSTNIFLIASIVFVTVGSGFLARAGMHYADAAENNSIGRDISECPGCVTNDQIIVAYSESIRVKLQDDLQDMIFNAGIGIALFSMGVGFSAVYMRYYRNVQPIL